MYRRQTDEVLINKMFMPSAEKENNQRVIRKQGSKAKDFIIPDLKSSDIQQEIRDHVKNLFYKPVQ